MSKLTSLLKSRVQTVAHGSKEKQKGASALEYIVLAAVIVIAVSIGALVLKPQIDNSDTSIFSKIKTALTSSSTTP